MTLKPHYLLSYPKGTRYARELRCTIADTLHAKRHIDIKIFYDTNIDKTIGFMLPHAIGIDLYKLCRNLELFGWYVHSCLVYGLCSWIIVHKVEESDVEFEESRVDGTRRIVTCHQ